MARGRTFQLLTTSLSLLSPRRSAVEPNGELFGDLKIVPTRRKMLRTPSYVKGRRGSLSGCWLEGREKCDDTIIALRRRDRWRCAERRSALNADKLKHNRILQNERSLSSQSLLVDLFYRSAIKCNSKYVRGLQ